MFEESPEGIGVVRFSDEDGHFARSGLGVEEVEVGMDPMKKFMGFTESEAG
jgi:hypothetical protein